jgi:hypothetical protein
VLVGLRARALLQVLQLLQVLLQVLQVLQANLNHNARVRVRVRAVDLTVCRAPLMAYETRAGAP